MKHLQFFSLGLLLTLASSFASASPEKLLGQLQQMRLTSISSMTNFFMFSSLNADRKYERRMLKDIAAFDEALKSAQSLVSSGTPNEYISSIEADWNSYRTTIKAHQKTLDNMGQIAPEESMAVGKQGNALSSSIAKAYDSIASATSASPNVKRARELAILLQEMTTQYAASGSGGDEVYHSGEYKRSMVDMSQAFTEELKKLSAKTSNTDATFLLENINSKWRLLNQSLNNGEGGTVPFMIISFNDRIIHHLAELETKVQ